MGAGLLIYDLLYVVMSSIFYGTAALVGARAHAALSTVVPWWLALFPAFVAALLVMIAQASLVCALLPRLQPGRYAMMKGAVFYGWLFRTLTRRVLFAPGLRWVLFSSNTLRFLTMRGLGARVAFTTNMSTDAEILDPWLFEAGPGATIGTRCVISGHYVERGQLVLDVVTIGAGALLAAEVGVLPGVTIGGHAVLKVRSGAGRNVTIGERAVVGAYAYLDTGSTIGAGARIATRAHVLPATVVSDHGAFDVAASPSSTTSSAAPAV